MPLARSNGLIRWWVAGLLILLLAACQAPPTLTVAPTPEWLRIQMDSSLISLQPQLQACLPAGAALAILGPSDPGLADLRLTWGIPPAQADYAAQLGEETLVLAAHPQNPLSTISLDELRLLYTTGQTTRETPALKPWAYPGGTALELLFEDEALSPGQQIASSVGVLPSPQAMLQQVAAAPEAVGFLPRRWLDASVKEIQVEGLAAGALQRPILALSASEPHGLARAWLVCLQESLKNQP